MNAAPEPAVFTTVTRSRAQTLGGIFVNVDEHIQAPFGNLLCRIRYSPSELSLITRALITLLTGEIRKCTNTRLE
jgi:hypothetical protein